MTRNAAMIERIQAAPVRYPFSFTLLGDCGVAPDPLQDVIHGELLHQMERLDPRPLFVATLGDFSNGGNREGHERFLQIAERLTLPNICIAGNHEMDYPEGVSVFQAVHGSPNFCFIYGNTLFAAVHISDYPQGPSDDDLAQLEQNLHAHDAQCPNKIIFIHQPPNLYNHYAPVAHWGFAKRETEFIGLVFKYRVRLVCSAHVTAFDRTVLDAVPFVVSGGGGWPILTYGLPQTDKPPHRGSFFHFVEITVQETGKISGRVYRAFRGTHDDPGYRF